MSETIKKCFVVNSVLFSILIYIVMAHNFTTFSNKDDVHKYRFRRHVIFTKSSKYFFRFNGKYNMLNYTTIFAFGYGSFRMNWDLPHSIPRRHRFFRRDIHDDLQNIPNEIASKGVSCLIKNLCQTFDQFRQLQTCGFFCEIGKIIMREDGLEANFFKNLVNKCDHYKEACPHNDTQIVTDVGYG